MRKSILIVTLIVASIIVTSLVYVEAKVDETPSFETSLSSLSSIWLYGAPNSWGSIGFDDVGKSISTAKASTNTFYHWADTLESMTKKTLNLQADLILYSPNGYNALVEETATNILDEATRRKRDNVRIAIDISVPAKWKVIDVEKLVKIIFKGKSGYLSQDFLDKYGDKIDLSIDFEPPVFYNNLYISSKQVNHLYESYAALRGSSGKVYIYNFGNMVSSPEKLNENIITIYNGISNHQDNLADRYRNILNVTGRPIGIMVFVLPHLGAKQRMGAFDKGDLNDVLKWLVNQKIDVPILGFQ